MLNAHYFDGQSAKARPAQLDLVQGQWVLHQEGQPTQYYPSAQVQIQEAIKNSPRRLNLPDGAIVEIDDQAQFERLLTESGLQRSLIDRAQNSWRLALGALALSALAVLASYVWFLPWASNLVARQVPASLERSMGDQAWSLMDKQMFAPSALPPQRQEALLQGFARLLEQESASGRPAAQLLFRKSGGNPNAFALPGGRMILTDEMVALADQLGRDADAALLGVIAHELGHVEHRHSLRQLVQATAITGIVSLWLGDVSTIVAGIPVAIVEMKYSRDFETEADTYAIDLLTKSGIPTGPTASLFESLLKQEAGEPNSIFSSHPPTAQRAQRFRGGSTAGTSDPAQAPKR